MRIRFRLLGSLRQAGRAQVDVDVAEGSSLRDALGRLVETSASLASAFASEGRNLILLDGAEVGNLEGFDTKLHDGAEVVVVPVVHGG